jgi:hypothetical protein
LVALERVWLVDDETNGISWPLGNLTERLAYRARLAIRH